MRVLDLLKALAGTQFTLPLWAWVSLAAVLCFAPDGMAGAALVFLATFFALMAGAGSDDDDDFDPWSRS